MPIHSLPDFLRLKDFLVTSASHQKGILSP